jgi:hypothetical protein
MATAVDLNSLGLPVEHSTEPQADNSIRARADIDIVFRNHRARLLAEIRRSPVILGCIAWLTDREILRALASCTHVSIVVQKEDFLRPDIGGGRAATLRPLYDSLPAPLTRYQLPGGSSGAKLLFGPFGQSGALCGQSQ